MRSSIRCLLLAHLLIATGSVLAAGINDTVQSTIPEVVTAGNAIQLIKEGLEGSEGPLPLKDGTVLMTENRAGRILQIAANGAISVWADNTASGGANALALNPQGEVVATMTAPAGIGIVTPGAAPKMLVKDYQGAAFNRPNDLIVSKRGTIYFTDPAGAVAAGAPAKPSSVYMLGTDGTLTLVSGEMTRPNGIALSPDERTLYVADTASDWLMAFGLDKEGKPGKGRKFGRLDKPTKPLEAGGAGADGLAVDEKGRVYVATAMGVQVLSSRGELMGIVSTPVAPQNLAFGGSNRSMLHVVGRGNVYVIGMETRGPRRDGK